MNKNGTVMTLVQAGPGAGKTRDLVGRIRALLDQGVSPFSILPLTFCREAAMEITERLDGDVAAKTNHSFSLNLITIAAKARGETVPRIVDDEQQKRIMERAAQEVHRTKMDLGYVMKKIATCRDVGIPLENLEPAVEEIARRYFQIMEAENLMDFTGILERAQKELGNPDIQEFIRDMHVFEDEGQDANPYNEWPILQKLYEESQGFTMFASPSQQIYGFRGADWERLEKLFPEDYRTETKLENHRSTPEIVKASCALAGPDARDMIPVNPSINVPVLWVDAVNPDMELDYIGAQVAKWISSGAVSKPSQIGILTRVHSQLFPIQRVLRARDIPIILVSNKQNPFHRIETRGLLGYLKLAADPMDDSMLEDIIDYPPCGIGSRRRFQLRRDDDMTWDHLLAAIADRGEFPEQVIQRIFAILDIRETLDQLNRVELSVAERITRTIDLTGMRVQLLADGDYNGIKALEDLVAASKEFNTIMEFAEYLDDELQKPRETEGVKLGTLHASKGLEWEAVIMPGMQNGLLPMSGGDDTEERNLAFVGVSRPKERLVLTSSATSQVSPFVPKIYQQAVKWPRSRR